MTRFDGFDVQGLTIERGEELQSTSIQNVSVLRNSGVVFDTSGTEKLFTIDEDIIGPIQALDLDLLGADLSTKRIDVEGSFVPEVIAIDLSSIDGIDLSNVLTRDENLSPRYSGFGRKRTSSRSKSNCFDKGSKFSREIKI